MIHIDLLQLFTFPPTSENGSDKLPHRPEYLGPSGSGISARISEIRLCSSDRSTALRVARHQIHPPTPNTTKLTTIIKKKNPTVGEQLYKAGMMRNSFNRKANADRTSDLACDENMAGQACCSADPSGQKNPTSHGMENI
jgi:hypothetical protein